MTASPPDVIALFEQLCPPSADRRTMFGHPCAFLDGNMFLGTFEGHLWVRLDQDARDEILEVDGAAPFQPAAGRPMREYVVFPEHWLGRPDVLEQWVARALAYARSLPPNPHRKRSRR